jgi:hypothetical protein
MALERGVVPGAVLTPKVLPSHEAASAQLFGRKTNGKRQAALG